MSVSNRVVESWLQNVPGFHGVVVDRVEQFAGGASNITCKVSLRESGTAAVVLRLQRDRGIFEPYDVLREAEVLRKLAPSAIPVPGLIAVEPDVAVLGAPFAVMEFVDAPHMGEAGADADYGAFTGVVAQIHQVEWRKLGLDFLATSDSAREATLTEVESVAGRMESFGCADDPLLREAVALLRRCAPTDGSLAFCQGDINVFNYLFRKKKVVAVVDWEQARISDPRSDIGQLVALSHLKGAPFGRAEDAGFVRAYEAVTGASLANMAYFRAFWLFQLGVIHDGWVAFNGSSPWYNRRDLDALLKQALAELA